MVQGRQGRCLCRRRAGGSPRRDRRDRQTGAAMSARVSVQRDRSIVESPRNSHNRIWPELAPIAAIDPGEVIELELRDGMDGQLTANSDAATLQSIDLDA